MRSFAAPISSGSGPREERAKQSENAIKKDFGATVDALKKIAPDDQAVTTGRKIKTRDARDRQMFLTLSPEFESAVLNVHNVTMPSRARGLFRRFNACHRARPAGEVSQLDLA